jgi:hypothetical protein
MDNVLRHTFDGGVDIINVAVYFSDFNHQNLQNRIGQFLGLLTTKELVL